ncbi:protein ACCUMULATION AND REPLICATION OF CHLOROPLASTS 3, chloroplastic isoform X1 [Amaranthus tricolor]|uniref:protein ACCUMULATION AND REPLICATION OF CHLOROPLASTS 3, chloroplastic isoform X1 n=1 Tax=Amaranthus tricolor TaxID=29722 RepID=UPI00258B2FB7|nr:protein ACCUMULATION AND REPLICATION OF CHLOROPLASTS 3, chloroplastic isoform X1 [Amaranthus tricolor]
MAKLSTFSSPILKKPSICFLKASNSFSFSSASLSFYSHISFGKSSTVLNKKWINISCSNSSSLKNCSNSNVNCYGKSADIWSDSKFVEVIGIGNRVDSVLDFCLSSSSSHSLRFWNVTRKESLQGQLCQRILEKEKSPNIVDVPVNQQLHSKAIVLVASAGYGDDYVMAIDILRMIRSSGGLAVAVVVKPFSFEGQRRQDEVKLLIDKLQNSVNFCIDIDIDTLLKMDLVTLDEALKTAYQAVLSAINAVSILVSDTYKKHMHSLHDSLTQIAVGEIVKVLESYKEGRVGFGTGHNVKASIVQAVYDCPFLSIGLKDHDGVVICILSSSSAIGDTDVCTLLRTFREVTEYNKEVILSIVRNPNMKPNMIGTTVITVGVSEKKPLQKSNILSRLADSIPFVFNFLRRQDTQSGKPEENNLRENIFPSTLANFMNEVLVDENYGEKDSDDGETNKVDYQDNDGYASKCIEQNIQAVQTIARKLSINRNLSRGHPQEWHEEEINVSGADPMADNPRTILLPVGVRFSDDLQRTRDESNLSPAEKIDNEDVKMQASALLGVPSPNGTTNGFWNSASVLLKRKQLIASKKHGGLSARAASMLESERDTNTRWSPVMEIRYRGGVYKGRCQGGLPEGRGRLTFLDGTVYDGMWRYGKRSGIGSLFFSNGDVFHGSWRDDLMHGKGWLYFHTGERWFANFWKGRANGEGRFYSKSGEVFFGYFQDGWRHGQFLHVKVDGTRFVETWEEGILVSSEEVNT